MSWSTVVRDRDSWTTQAVLLGMALIVLAAGFCVFDAYSHDGMDDQPALDLCLAMLFVSLPTALASRLPLNGRTATDRFAPMHEFSPHVPAPPPKPRS